MGSWRLSHVFQLDRIGSAIKGEESTESLYYALMEYRETEPDFFPAHDICLLAANAAMSIGQGEEVALLDWRMLPAAILLAGKGIRINLPNGSKVTGILKEYVPQGGWEIGGSGIALGMHPEEPASKSTDFIERLKNAPAGVFCCGTYFLDRPSLSHLRLNMLQAGLIQKVLQIPKPRRQKAHFYPCIVAFEKDRTETIRLAAINECSPGPGAIDMDMAMELMWEKADGASSKDVPLEDIYNNQKRSLFPLSWLGSEKPKGGKLLAQLAEIIRSSAQRRKAETGAKIGDTGNGTLVCREITLSEIDELTGFVSPTKGSLTRAQLSPIGLDGRLLLKKGDTIMFFRGTDNTLGKVGLVEKAGNYAIPCQAMCVIRALPKIDPAWLFYALRRPEIAEYIRHRASGGRVRMASMDTIRTLSLDEPDKEKVEKINATHKRIANKATEIERIKRELKADTMDIRKLI